MRRERPPPPRRSGFSSSDPSETRDFMDEAFGGYLDIQGWRSESWELAVDQIIAAELATGEVTMPADLTYQVDGHDELVITTVLGGNARYVARDGEERMGIGDVYAGNHQALHCICHTHQLRAHTVSLPQSLMRAAAAEISSGSVADWRLTSIRPIPGSSRPWRQATRFIDELLADPEAGAAPLIIAPAARLLAATVLAIFPHTATAPAATKGGDAHPQTLRRAIAFIDANPDLDLTLVGIARCANVTPRAVQLAFRRHLDTTPMAYLRRVRLHHAHQQLLDAQPEGELTVARIAVDWGFASPGRFAAYYRGEYGESPSVTLRR